MTRYELDEAIPLGVVPDEMYAAVVRRQRYGEPMSAYRTEVLPVPRPGRGQVLVRMMAAGVNYNGIWAARGAPVDVIAMRQQRGETEQFHVGGSDGVGIVWELGDDVDGLDVGDHVVLSGISFNERAWDVRLGADPASSDSAAAWGYENNYGCFAQFAVVDDYQCHPKPQRLSWHDSAGVVLTGTTAYRQLCGWEPHVVRPGDPVLIWGGAGGLGSMAIQITKARGGIPIAVVSSAERAQYCLDLGARGVIDRSKFSHWGRLPDIGTGSGVDDWLRGVRAFGRAYWEALGERRSPRIVLEHSGQDTIPTSMYLCDSEGMVVICGGTSGYNADVDLRFLWMRQKRLQGSHFGGLAHVREVLALVDQGLLDPCVEWTGSFEDVGSAHQLLLEPSRPNGNLVVTIGANAPDVVEGGLSSGGRAMVQSGE